MAVRDVGEDLHHVRRDRPAGLGQRLGEAVGFQDGAQEGVGGKVAVAEGVADGNAEQDVLADRGVLVVAVGVERIDRIGEAGRVQRHANRPPRLDEGRGEIRPPGGVDRCRRARGAGSGRRDRRSRPPRRGAARRRESPRRRSRRGGSPAGRRRAGSSRRRHRRCAAPAPPGWRGARSTPPKVRRPLDGSSRPPKEPGEDAGAPVAVVRQGEMGGKGDGQVDRREAGAARPVEGRDPLRREPAGARQVHRAPAASGASAGLRRASARSAKSGRTASRALCQRARLDHGRVAAERGRDRGGDGSGGRLAVQAEPGADPERAGGSGEERGERQRAPPTPPGDRRRGPGRGSPAQRFVEAPALLRGRAVGAKGGQAGGRGREGPPERRRLARRARSVRASPGPRRRNGSTTAAATIAEENGGGQPQRRGSARRAGPGSSPRTPPRG